MHRGDGGTGRDDGRSLSSSPALEAYLQRPLRQYCVLVHPKLDLPTGLHKVPKSVSTPGHHALLRGVENFSCADLRGHPQELSSCRVDVESEQERAPQNPPPRFRKTCRELLKFT